MAKKTTDKKNNPKRNINTPTLLNLYKNKILPSMMKQHNYSNIMEVPKLLSISLNIGVGDAKTNSKSFESAINELSLISGQKPVNTLAKKDISAVLDSLGAQINRHVKKGAVGQFTLPGLLKIKTVKKPARPAQKNVPNPFQPGTTMDVAAKPASVQVKALALKKLKDMAK